MRGLQQPVPSGYELGRYVPTYSWRPFYTTDSGYTIQEHTSVMLPEVAKAMGLGRGLTGPGAWNPNATFHANAKGLLDLIANLLEPPAWPNEILTPIRNREVFECPLMYLPEKERGAPMAGKSYSRLLEVLKP